MRRLGESETAETRNSHCLFLFWFGFTLEYVRFESGFRDLTLCCKVLRGSGACVLPPQVILWGSGTRVCVLYVPGSREVGESCIWLLCVWLWGVRNVSIRTTTAFFAWTAKVPERKEMVVVFRQVDRLEWVSVGWANWIPEILKTLQISCKNDSTNLETRKLEPTFTLTNTVQNTKWKWKMRKRCFRAKLRQKLQICCEISFLCDFFGVRLLCCETSLLWDLLAARFLCCEVSLPWDLFAVSLFAMRSLCCETSCCETSWLWDLFGVRLLWCETSLVWELGDFFVVRLL